MNQSAEICKHRFCHTYRTSPCRDCGAPRCVAEGHKFAKRRPAVGWPGDPVRKKGDCLYCGVPEIEYGIGNREIRPEQSDDLSIRAMRNALRETQKWRRVGGRACRYTYLGEWDKKQGRYPIYTDRKIGYGVRSPGYIEPRPDHYLIVMGRRRIKVTTPAEVTAAVGATFGNIY